MKTKICEGCGCVLQEYRPMPTLFVCWPCYDCGICILSPETWLEYGEDLNADPQRIMVYKMEDVKKDAN